MDGLKYFRWLQKKEDDYTIIDNMREGEEAEIVELKSRGIDFVWCIHCERCMPVEDAVHNLNVCVYDDCDGMGIGVDLWPWQKGQGVINNHPEYPEIPEEGVIYPLY
jgi:hypothetical protein